MTAPKRYRKKPVVIDAIQWTGDNLRDVICFTDGPPDTRTNHAGMMWEKYEDLVQRDGLKIYTLEGTMNANIGDYIIKGVKGEFYPCKPDIFAATYDPADLAAVPAQVRVKHLVWEMDGDTHSAKTQIGEYRVANIHGQWMWFFLWNPRSNEDRIEKGCGKKNNPNSAKDAAQAAHLRRIRDTIDAQPDPRDEVIARLVEALGISANRLDWCAVDYETGSRKFIVTSEWADEARAALAAAKAVQK